MKIIIIEDELKAAKSLENLIGKIRPTATILAKLQSIESSIDYLLNNELPDLIFMDIQLSDGLCFEIFKSVKISCPVVFCTAYGEYAMDAIKANGVDYLLKPFSEEDLVTAFEKVDNFKNFFQQKPTTGLDDLLLKIGLAEGKKSFLVFRNNKYTTVQTEQIAFIYIKYTSPSIMTFQGEEYSITQSLDQVQGQLSSKQFFRLNRQYLINFSAIKEVEHYFARKLFVRLSVPTPEKLLIGKEKTTAFLQWLENR
ncbi:two component transcriptional regulator, LytTR family [Chitinophaga sp. CF118]|uniref:LytR/AlgR family response regulator transcription factor n=1 Tax=Chitinophaga sp. CF118 TaxID=1884367 RepID=UPI0008EE207E|nr:LytTR family DNA-binding domain-containing protein [Chitinophaga sp. CF118]SFD97826.1 two component transcriptional regulator, LytTR family [Chitinophaga sp. CF118]